jgi:hypothetical protein
MSHGFYSLIQYIPDYERAEGANIGVLVFCPLAAERVAAAWSPRPPHLRDLCRRDVPSEQDLADLMQRLQRRLQQDAPADLPGLIKAMGREAGKLRLVTPRAVPVTDLRETAQDLCQRLVGETQQRERMPGKIAEIEALRAEPGMAEIIRTGVSVPVAGKVLRASYEWTNGKPNVVVHTGLRDDHSAADAAYGWGGKGLMLLERPVDNIARKLAVVARIDSQVSERTRGDIRSIFEKFKVDWIPSDELPAYVARIRREAHAT